MIKDKPVQTFLDDLASKASTPGGGSAAAIMGAMGAALVSMVANLTVGKKNYEEVDAEMQDLLSRSHHLTTFWILLETIVTFKLTEAAVADLQEIYNYTKAK